MSDDPESKTEEATPRKLEEAREKGDVAKSPDVAAWLSLAAACGVLITMGGSFSDTLAQALTPYLAAPHDMTGMLEAGGGSEIFRRALLAALPFFAAVMFATALGGAGGNFLQTGFIWSPEKLRPDFKKLSPIGGLKRMFGLDGLVQFGKTLLKLVITCWVAYAVLAPHAYELQTLAALGPAAVMTLSIDLIKALVGAVLALLGLLAAVDWLWQRLRFAKKMRMSREELKEEYKQTEGDPHVKGKLKQMRAEKAKRRMMANVPKATVIITNPTHYAVALRYVSGEDSAPLCLAKGVDTLALKIREIAGEHDIPIIEDPPLARALYATVEIDDTIPREHYEAVAQVIGFVMGPQKGKGQKSGGGPPAGGRAAPARPRHS